MNAVVWVDRSGYAHAWRMHSREMFTGTSEDHVSRMKFAKVDIVSINIIRVLLEKCLVDAVFDATYISGESRRMKCQGK